MCVIISTFLFNIFNCENEDINLDINPKHLFDLEKIILYVKYFAVLKITSHQIISRIFHPC